VKLLGNKAFTSPWRFVKAYHITFVILAKYFFLWGIQKIISEKMRLNLIQMKKMRNVLVHRYGEIKDQEVYESLTDNLEDFEKFKEEILRFLKK